MKANTRCTYPLCVCASEHIKLIGTTDGMFPEFGHHMEREMGGLWMHPVKLLDGFWLRLEDHSCDNVNTWIKADSFENNPWGNRFYYRSGLGHTTIEIYRTQIAPEDVPGAAIAYDLHNYGATAHDITVEFAARTDLRPVWFSETEGLVPGAGEVAQWDEQACAFISRDSDHPWFVGISSDTAMDDVRIGDVCVPDMTGTKGTGVSMIASMTLQPGECRRLTFFVSGSLTSQEEVLSRLATLQGMDDMLEQKQARYEALLRKSRLTSGDARFDEIYDWVRVNTDWLIVSTQDHGRGLAAGLPEYPWWFGCDNCYSLQGVLAMGDFATVRDTLDILLTTSERVNGNGRIIHEVTTAGICANPGNTQETAHFVVMLWMYYRWTGDRAFLEKALPYVRKSIAWLQEQDDDGDLFPGGYGIIEIAGLNSEMIDTAVYTAQAYGCYADMLNLLTGEDASPYRDLAERTRDAINTLMWDEDAGLYCDTFTSPSVVRQKREQIVGRVANSDRARVDAYMDGLLAKKDKLGEVESGWLINGNWVINTPMETGIAPRDKAVRALDRLHTPEFIGPYGMYLNSLLHSSTMTISTGVMAVAQARYGYADRALELLERTYTTFGRATPGAISEMSPDYGCFVQAWTVYGTMTTVVEHFFGVQPDCWNGCVRLAPQPPTAWRDVSLQSVQLPGGEISLHLAQGKMGLAIAGEYTGTLPLVLHVPAGTEAKIGDTAYPAQPKARDLPLPAGAFTAWMRQTDR